MIILLFLIASMPTSDTHHHAINDEFQKAYNEDQMNTDVLDALWNDPTIPADDKNETLHYAVYHNKLDFINKHWHDPVITDKGKLNAFYRQLPHGYNLDFLDKYWHDPIVSDKDRENMMGYILGTQLSERTWRFILGKVDTETSQKMRNRIGYQAILALTYPDDDNYNPSLNEIINHVREKIIAIDMLENSTVLHNQVRQSTNHPSRRAVF